MPVAMALFFNVVAIPWLCERIAHDQIIYPHVSCLNPYSFEYVRVTSHLLDYQGVKATKKDTKTHTLGETLTKSWISSSPPT